MRRAVAALYLALSIAPARAALPLAEEVDAAELRQHCRQLLEALGQFPGVLFPDVERELRKSLAADLPDAARIQELLDGQCLVGVSINPESRVKAARGPAPAELTRERPRFVLIKVHNEAGVTHPLVVTGPQLRAAHQPDPGRWLEAVAAGSPPLPRALTGATVQYVLFRLTAHESGKREATFRFDVGQGTQDLGFRAEVPILFTVR